MVCYMYCILKHFNATWGISYVASCAVLLLIIVSALKVLDFSKADYTRIYEVITFWSHLLLVI